MMRRLFSFPALLAIVLCASAVIITSVPDFPVGKVFVEGDAWWHLTVGQKILHTHHWPAADTYSHSAAGAPWIAYSWFPEIVTALAFRAGGLRGLAVFLVLACASFIALLLYYTYLRTQSIKAAAIACGLLLPVVGAFSTLRPQLIGYVCLVTVFIAVEQFRRGRRVLLWLLPAVFAVWVNSHGSFVFGLGYMALAWGTAWRKWQGGFLYTDGWPPEKRREFLTVLLLCVGALCITPYGTRLAAYPFEFSVFQSQVTAVVTEWQAMPFTQAFEFVFLLLTAAIVAMQFVKPFLVRADDAILFAYSVVASVLHVRLLPLFVLAAAPILASAFRRVVPAYDPQKDRPLVNAVLMALVVAAAVALFPSRSALEYRMAALYPVQAVDYLRQAPAGTIWNDDTWGGFLIWKASPATRVFIDGRLDIYDYSGVISDYISSSRGGPQADFVMRKYRIDTILVQKKKAQELERYLSRSPEWQTLYSDNIATVLRRKQTTAAPAATR